ncbi:hypothetical protein [Psychroflexus salis]|uniref:Uncharacterized protein n=1 Tax=Psychroflexus salis TaxID=1526574 RepID=A0A916ZZT2_9FLAO|nr:hypothetical protein [Psychroflexus salis]GGE20566.1 hypothetical protein GCM10010831_22080 [Psychroflexus salis]
MKKSKLFIFGLFIVLACQKKKIDLVNIPTTTKDGYIQVLVSTSLRDSVISNFNFEKKNLELTKQNHFLKGIASLGYIAGKNKNNEAIVLGENKSKNHLKQLKSIGLARVEWHNQTKDWFGFTEKNGNIKSFEDFVVNHISLNKNLQEALINQNTKAGGRVIWYGEAFLDSELNLS